MPKHCRYLLLERAAAARQTVREGVDPLLALSYVIDPTPNQIAAQTDRLLWAGVRPIPDDVQYRERRERENLYRQFRRAA